MLSFIQARHLVQKNLNIKSQQDYRSFLKKNKNLPYHPDRSYKSNGWINWPDFLRGEKKQTKITDKTSVPSYSNFKKLLTDNNIKTVKDYKKFRDTSNNSLPAFPNRFYVEFEGWHIIFDKPYKNYVDYIVCQKLARSLNLKTQKEWYSYWKTHERRKGIPISPDVSYKNKGWVNWYIFLGTKNFVTFLEFDKAKKYVQKEIKKNKFTPNKNGWTSYCIIKPNNIPSNPYSVYKNKGWISWGDWFGTYTIQPQRLINYDFDFLNTHIKKYSLLNMKGYMKLQKNNKTDIVLPVAPDQVFRKKGWVSWEDFLGHGNKSSHTISKERKEKILQLLTEFQNSFETMKSDEIIVFIRTHLGNLPQVKQLQKLAFTAPNSKARKESFKQFVKAVKNNSLEENGNIVEEIKESTDSKISTKLFNVEKFSIENYFKSYSDDVLAGIDDPTKIDFIVNNRLNEMWNLHINGRLSLDDIKNKRNYSRFLTTVIDKFLSEHNQITSLKQPEWYNGYTPYLAQSLFAYRMVKNKNYGNFSDTGDGKSLSVINTVVHSGVMNTLIIGINQVIKNTRDNWQLEIKRSIPSANIFVGIDDKTILPNKERNFILLNFEFFQSANAERKLSNFLKKNKIDFVVVDEGHLVKQRMESNLSKRRELLIKFMSNLRKDNPELYSTVLTATPLINNLQEVKSMMELLTGHDYSQMGVEKESVFDWRVELINNGIIFSSTKENEKGEKLTFKEIQKEIKLTRKTNKMLYDTIIEAGKDGDDLKVEQLALEYKLNGIRKDISSGTIIYSPYVKGITIPAKRILESWGYSVASFTGSESTEERNNILAEFKDKKIDIILGSSPISTGIDGLQKAGHTIVFLTLPWTYAEFKQIRDRVYRNKSKFNKIKIVLPQLIIMDGKKKHSRDLDRYHIISTKNDLSTILMTGEIKGKIHNNKKVREKFNKEMGELIERIKKDESKILEKMKTEPIDFNSDEYINSNKVVSEFNKMNKQLSSMSAKNLSKKIKLNPKHGLKYLQLRSEYVKQWEENPPLEIAKKIKRKDYTIADMGCGDAILAQTLTKNKVHSFDHIPANKHVKVCDITKTPLKNESVDVAVYSLALWGRDQDMENYFKEANRILKHDGIIHIAEPKGRNVTEIVKVLEKTGFKMYPEKNSSKFVYLEGKKIA